MKDNVGNPTDTCRRKTAGSAEEWRYQEPAKKVSRCRERVSASGTTYVGSCGHRGDRRLNNGNFGKREFTSFQKHMLKAKGKKGPSYQSPWEEHRTRSTSQAAPGGTCSCLSFTQQLKYDQRTQTRSGLETQVGCRHSSVVELDLTYSGTWGSVHNMRHAGSAMGEGECK